MSTLNAGEMTLDEFHAKALSLGQLEKRNWREHFATHPEQLLPGAKVKRVVPLEEADLLAELLGRCPSGPDEDE